jgi:hypothetical protein
VSALTKPALYVACWQILLQKSATTTARVENEAVDGVVCHLLTGSGQLLPMPLGLRRTYAKALLCSRRRSHQKLGEPPEVLSDSS